MTVPTCHSGQGTFGGAQPKAVRPALDTWTLASTWHLRSGDTDPVVFVWLYTSCSIIVVLSQCGLQFVQMQFIMRGFLHWLEEHRTASNHSNPSLTTNPSDTILFTQNEYFYVHLSAVFEWMLSVNLELFELSFAVEFCFFSSSMLSNLLSRPNEEKPLMMTTS